MQKKLGGLGVKLFEPPVHCQWLFT